MHILPRLPRRISFGGGLGGWGVSQGDGGWQITFLLLALYLHNLKHALNFSLELAMRS